MFKKYLQIWNEGNREDILGVFPQQIPRSTGTWEWPDCAYQKWSQVSPSLVLTLMSDLFKIVHFE